MYASKADIWNMYGEVFVIDVLPSDLEDEDGAIEMALENASAEIDSYLSVRYSLPLSEKPASLKRPTIDIAIYILANRHSRLTETMESRYEQAIDLLTKISTGKAGLGRAEPKIDSGGDGSTSTSGSAFSANARRFGRSNM